MDLKSDALFSALIEAAVDGIVVIDTRGTVLVYSAACERLFGYPADEIIGQNVSMLMPSPYLEAHDGYLAKYLRTGEKRGVGTGREVVGRRKDNTTLPMYLSLGESEIDGQRIFVGIIHDLSAIRSAEHKGEASDRYLANIVSSSGDIIVSKTLDGIVTSWNAAAERIFGYTAEEMIGKSISVIVPPERQSEEWDILRHIRAGELIERFETTRRCKDGTDIIVSLSISPLRDASGKVIGASKIARDVTEQHKIEKKAINLLSELAHVSRLGAMGQMTAAIAHELNQPLTAITNYISAAKRTLSSHESEPVIVRALGMMEHAAAQTLRAGGIIRNLRDFVDKHESRHEPEDLNKVVEEAAALGLLGASDSGVKTRCHLDRTLGPVRIDKIQIQQVLLNLIRNSMEAMAPARKGELILSTGPDGPGFAQVTVADTGPGLSPEVAMRLFQPFTTTKKKGMGIGLNICHSIVEAHGGCIWVLPSAGVGTAFRIRLPFADLVGGVE